MPGREYQYDVFISYGYEDREWVRGWLLPRLEAEKLKTCVDFRDFQPGQPRVREIERATRESRRMVLVLTPEYATDEWAKFEAVLGQTLDPSAERRRLVPLVLKPYALPPRLRQLVHLDFTHEGYTDDEFTRLVKALLVPEEIATRKQGKPESAQATERALRVFFVDDNDSFRKDVKAWLEEAGHIVHDCRSYSEALMILQVEEPFDVAMLDLLLGPEQTDFTGLFLLEETILVWRIPTVILTAYGFVKLTRVAQDLGVSVVLDKTNLRAEPLLANVARASLTKAQLEEKVDTTDSEVWHQQIGELYQSLVRRELGEKAEVEAVRSTILRHRNRIQELYRLEEQLGPEAGMRNELQALITRVAELQQQLFEMEPLGYGVPSQYSGLGAQRSLRRRLLDALSEDQLRALCESLGVDYGALPGIDQASKARELVLSFVRQGRLGKLAQAVDEQSQRAPCS